MVESQNDLDFPAGGTPVVRNAGAIPVPRYSLYGDPTLQRDWVFNVEPLARRAREKGWAIDPHVHPKFTQLVFVSKGGGTMTIDGDVVEFDAPCVLVVPIFHVHSFRYRAPADGKVLTLEDSYLADLLTRAAELKPILRTAGAFAMSPPAWRSVAAGLKSLVEELVEARTGQRIAAEMLLLKILLAMLRDRPAEGQFGASGRAEVVERFLALVEERFRDQPSLAELAAEMGMTEAQLRLACRGSTGMAPLSILHDRALAEAKRCLAYTSLSIAEIAYALGYDDAAYFSRFFTKKIGQSPSQFRRTRGMSG
ncbi:helix-turn-helix domain-containing protein [Sphingomonas sp. HITSZ_GF]|uniref:helix-turn-helix domain-containing protein n=1 Tax=Sphingomonas sp. HITSZ_GF TaxID=3037247 RepID=UPI00240E30FF|nr:helix-turn-helix domain-containing protein [Sphingomonas sp. HITSZ_GF]MDG2533024.1 helix-turn-helix domain-containing protein [Sphingomonas sp. HITSZ_GF]